ncbi:hypothetical protein NEPAR06_0707 [Nematocida parisii]|uniref:Uncharacterized protein n=1 Tax=Nematocida parisii (strain ERTm3) TaxID=935791 RepID=I3EHU5_NEMP3|nr:uncharacterized protein NEPG_02391 [Nematocida parisii ERTm1]EIJ88792.1 hypothetical protein NEQG_00611 [Nematocida parisii ERTm3]KAI5143022.1 hypothetical protein NEPAR07_0438 [Nematocida parisii]EIJ92700.1 hypothetical protein NEPG_02391 [Nematocida parisii ERTm1]KAI5153749.1 hypothetical protein NEPAR06_0707 [Nematocida parisii]KAI5156138.1 hypothetical protein NEPAR05_0315 [Nematocida parisii]|eukprot:XP_013060218.1 hypothetical protein NEPG_02391 [Nematocida parisii ERTm1]
MRTSTLPLLLFFLYESLAIALPRTYESTGLPTQGLLYNYGSYGFVSTPKIFEGVPMGNLIVIGRDNDIKLGITIFQPIKMVPVYNLKVTPAKLAGDKKAGNSSEQVLSMTPLGMLTKLPYDERNPLQYFTILLAKNFPGYFRIISSTGLCLTPNRKQLLTLSLCWSENSRVITKQLFKMYKKDNDDKNSDPIYIQKGISPYYFRGCAPCTRSIPDPSNGEYILVNSKYCEENCGKNQQPNPNEKPENLHVPNPPHQQQNSSGGQQSSPSFGRQQSSPSSGGQQSSPSSGGQQSSPSSGRQQSSPSSGGQQSSPSSGGWQSSPSSQYNPSESNNSSQNSAQPEQQSNPAPGSGSSPSSQPATSGEQPSSQPAESVEYSSSEPKTTTEEITSTDPNNPGKTTITTTTRSSSSRHVRPMP